MHIFLTGEIQVGKSTLIRQVLAQLPPVRLGGFRTVTVADVPGALGSVYILGADEASEPEAKVALRRGPGLGALAYPNAFDQWGTALLADAEAAQLILMDEVGRLEAEAEVFQGRIRALLEGDIPIFGVVQRRGATALQAAIRTHPRVRLVEVTRDNREALVPELAQILGREVRRRIDSAGAFVFRGQETEVLMIRTRRGWAFPKGRMEPGETEAETACREIREETGIDAALLPGFRYQVPSGLAGERRRVTYFLGVPTGGLLTPQLSEVREAAWIPAAQAASLIHFPQDLPAFQAALAHWKESRLANGPLPEYNAGERT